MTTGTIKMTNGTNYSIQDGPRGWLWNIAKQNLIDNAPEGSPPPSNAEILRRMRDLAQHNDIALNAKNDLANPSQYRVGNPIKLTEYKAPSMDAVSAGKDTISRYQSGDSIPKLREMLKSKGYELKGTGNVYDAEMRDAVIDLQKKCGIHADGVVGARTLRELSAASEQKDGLDAKRGNTNTANVPKVDAKGSGKRGPDDPTSDTVTVAKRNAPAEAQQNAQQDSAAVDGFLKSPSYEALKRAHPEAAEATLARLRAERDPKAQENLAKIVSGNYYADMPKEEQQKILDLSSNAGKNAALAKALNDFSRSRYFNQQKPELRSAMLDALGKDPTSEKNAEYVDRVFRSYADDKAKETLLKDDVRKTAVEELTAGHETTVKGIEKFALNPTFQGMSGAAQSALLGSIKAAPTDEAYLHGIQVMLRDGDFQGLKDESKALVLEKYAGVAGLGSARRSRFIDKVTSSDFAALNTTQQVQMLNVLADPKATANDLDRLDGPGWSEYLRELALRAMDI